MGCQKYFMFLFVKNYIYIFLDTDAYDLYMDDLSAYTLKNMKFFLFFFHGLLWFGLLDFRSF